MEKYYLQTIGLPVVDQQGTPLTRVTDLVLNPDSGKIISFAVTNRKVISPIDVLEWHNQLRIHDSQDIIDPSDIHDHNIAIEKGIQVYRNKVVTKEGEQIGRVIDFGLENKFFYLTCIVVAKSFLNFIFWDRKIIPAKDIIIIEHDKITVKDLVKPVKMKKLKLATTSNVTPTLDVA